MTSQSKRLLQLVCSTFQIRNLMFYFSKIDTTTGEWCDLSKPVRIRLPVSSYVACACAGLRPVFYGNVTDDVSCCVVADQRKFWRKQNRR